MLSYQHHLFTYLQLVKTIYTLSYLKLIFCLLCFSLTSASFNSCCSRPTLVSNESSYIYLISIKSINSIIRYYLSNINSSIFCVSAVLLCITTCGELLKDHYLVKQQENLVLLLN